MMRRRQFDRHYREALALPDGAALVRLLRPGDRALLLRGFSELSQASRVNRFFVAKAVLLEAELRYLTDIDQHDHLAFIVVRAGAEGEEGLAVARAVRLREDREGYECALTVIDRLQRRGLGRLLLRRLAAAVVERGGRYLRFCVLPGNDAMQALLARAAPAALWIEEAEALRVEVPLPLAQAASSPPALMGQPFCQRR